MRRRKIRWLLTPLIWLKNILDHEWWADFIGEKSEHMNVQEDQINLKNGSQNSHYGNKHL